MEVKIISFFLPDQLVFYYSKYNHILSPSDEPISLNPGTKWKTFNVNKLGIKFGNIFDHPAPSVQKDAVAPAQIIPWGWFPSK